MLRRKELKNRWAGEGGRLCFPGVLLLSLSFSFTTGGCASKGLDQKMVDLKRSDLSLRTELKDQTQRLDDLSNSLMIIQDRLETLKLEVDRAPVRTPYRKPVTSVAPKPVRRPKQKKYVKPEESLLGVGGVVNDSLPTIRLSNRDLKGGISQAKPKEQIASKDKGNPEVIQAYNQAYQQFEEEEYLQAVELLTRFVKRYPQHIYADNATYWIGESYFQTKDYKKAAFQFEKLVTRFPRGNKVPDALLRAGSCYLQMSNQGAAKRVLGQLIEQYPRSVAAQKARDYIRRM